jgi:hypothetical protein
MEDYQEFAGHAHFAEQQREHAEAYLEEFQALKKYCKYNKYTKIRITYIVNVQVCWNM